VEQPLTDSAKQIKIQMEALLRLQALDNEINARRKKVGGMEAELRQAESVLASRRKAMDGQKQELDHLIKDRREAERAAKERQEELSKFNSQLFEVKTNEAYNALQSEIRQKKQELSLFEERILEMMVSEDEMHAALDQTAAGLREEEGRLADLQNNHRQAISAIDREIENLQAQWQTVARDVQADYLDRYRRLREAKGGIAMAKIDNGICSGCRLTIRPQAIIELKKYRTFLFCENCARILYVD